MSKKEKALWMAATIIACVFFMYLGKAFTQTCDHTTSSKQRFDAIRLLPPSKIFWDGKTVTARYEDKQGVYVEELTTDERTAIHLPKDYKSKYFWLLYSTCDKHLYTATEVLPNQFK